jgi:hypothetical protein
VQEKQRRNWVNKGYQSGDLKFIRVFDMNLIPRKLMQQVKNQDLNIDLLYSVGNQVTGNPFTLLYAISDKESRIVGVFWATVTPIENTIWGQILSVDRERQDKTIIPSAIDFLKKIRDELGLKLVKCVTTRPRALEKYGMKRSRNIIMEA